MKKLENLVQNQSIGNVVPAQPTAAPRNSRRDHLEGIMTTRGTNPTPIEGWDANQRL